MTYKEKIYLLIVLLLFPAGYILFSYSSWNHHLFVDKFAQYYFLVFGAIILFHWVSLGIVYYFLKQENSNFKDIGYLLSKKGTIKLVGIYFLIALSIFGFLEYFITTNSLDTEGFNKLTAFIPKTTLQRLIFIFSVFSAGFCEEIIYRGYLISKLKKLGLNKWLAILPAGISFVFIHGQIAFTNFWFYFIPAIIFGVIFVLSKRLLPGIITHLAHNLFAILAVMQFIS